MLKATWNLRAVIAVHMLRFIIGIFIVRFIFPLFLEASPVVIELTDRLLVILLVVGTIRQTRGDLSKLGVSLQHWGRNIGKGLAGGLVLLILSQYSEHLYATLLLAAPAQHPLAVQVQNASSWQQLLVPVFLACIAAPVTEEMLYRLFTFLPLREKWGLWGGAIASAAIFALFHFNAYWLAEIMIVGVGLALLYAWTGSLLAAITAHSVINTSKIVLLVLGLPLL